MTDAKPPRIPLARPVMGEPEAAAAARAIKSGWVTQGPEVAAFEREFAATVGATHACAVANCTAALHLALLAVGARPGTEVVTVSHSYVATANSVRYTGAVPVFVDVRPDTLNMDPELLESALSSETVAILVVHQLGMPAALGAILPIARRHGIPVIEDAACAIGSEILVDSRWGRIGRPHGAIACFSFHPRKLLSTGDGGMLTTTNSDWDRQWRRWRQHGMSVADTRRHAAREVVFESHGWPAFNYRLTDIQAAVGREQLKRLEGLVSERRELVAVYRSKVEGVPGVTLPAEPSWARSNWQSLCVRLPEGCDQRAAMQGMLDRGIATRRGVMCAHVEPSYPPETWRCGSPGCGRNPCRHLLQSEAARDRTIILPLFPNMTEVDQDDVVSGLRLAVANARGKESEEL